jgi:hypothetical protein
MDELLKLALAVAASEEKARIESEKEKKRQEPPKAPTLTSEVIKLNNVLLPETLVEKNGSGVVKELIIKSQSKDYILSVYVDRVKLYSESFDWFQGISQSAETIDAFQDPDSSLYVLRLSDIHFKNSIIVMADPISGSVSLSDVFCHIDLLQSSD